MKGKWIGLTKIVLPGVFCAVVGGIFNVALAARHTITSLPYSATTNNDTLDIAGTKLTSSSSGITVSASNVVINLGSDTIVFGSTGITINNTSSVKVNGGTILKTSASGTKPRAVTIHNAHDITFAGTNMVVNGHDAQCVNVDGGLSGTYNLNFDGGTWRSNSESFTSRETYSGAVFLSGSFPATAGSYDVRIANVTITNGPCQGIIVKGKFIIEGCNITTDARNVYWDSVYLWKNRQAPVGQSADNSYLILCRFAEAGTIIRNNVLTSGTQYGGSRGILLENCAGTQSNPIEVYNNTCTIHAGPSGENLGGVTRVIRMRAIDGGTTSYIRIHDNTFIGIADNNTSTSAYGNDVAVMNLGFPSSSDTCVVERNRFIAKSTTTGTKVKACESTFNGTTFSHIVRNNYFSGSSIIIYLGDEYNGISTSKFRFQGDTLAFDSSFTFNKKTWNIGYSGGSSLDNIAVDCKFVNGASDTNITWYSTNGSNEMTLARTLDVQVLGSNALGVLGAAVTVKNHYGQTVLTGNTDANGHLTGRVTYWYRSDDWGDSTNFNNFTLTVKKLLDSTTLSFAVNATSAAPLPILSKTLGTGTGGGGGGNTAPTVPVLLSPINGASITARPIVLTVVNSIDPNGDPVKYDFWISKNSAFTQVVDSMKNVTAGVLQTTATFNAFVPVAGTTYWWRARATDGTNASNPSNAFNFTYQCGNLPNVSDLIALINYFAGTGPAPQRGDYNSDGTVTVTDIVFLVMYLFNGGPAPSCA